MPRQKNLSSPLPGLDLAHVLRLASAELEALRGRRLFITGGTGFFGKWLLGALCHADAELSLGLQVSRCSLAIRLYF